jgi:serine/threonine protein kinase
MGAGASSKKKDDGGAGDVVNDEGAREELVPAGDAPPQVGPVQEAEPKAGKKGGGVGAKPPPPKTPPPVQNNSSSDKMASEAAVTPEKSSDARGAAELSAQKQKIEANGVAPSGWGEKAVPRAAMAVETTPATAEKKLEADDFDPLNQTIGNPHQNKQGRGGGASERGKKKRNKQFTVDKTFEISISDLDLLERIGEGGFSTVHKARSKSNRSILAVKILKQQAPSEKTLESFAKEICLHSQIRHPHVLQFFGGCTQIPNLCLVTEYMFCSLQHALDHDADAFHPQMQVEIASCVALGLNHLHILNIMHRDLKASNVLLDKNYCNPKIADFGLARVKKETESDVTRGVGSPFAMAPEVFVSSTYDKPVDWYAFGVLVWQLVTKKHPYSGMKYVDIVNHVVKNNQRLTIPDDCHELVSTLMTKCWDRDPAARPTFAQAMEVLEELSETLEGSMLTAMTEETVREEFPSSPGGLEYDKSPREGGGDAVEFVETDFLSQTLSWEDILNLEAKINMKDLELEVMTLRRELEQTRRKASQDMAVQHHRSMQSKERIMEEHEDELRHLETSILQERMRQKIKLRKRLKMQKNKQTRPDITYALSLLNNPPKELKTSSGGGGEGEIQSKDLEESDVMV